MVYLLVRILELYKIPTLFPCYSTTRPTRPLLFAFSSLARMIVTEAEVFFTFFRYCYYFTRINAN